MKKQNKTIKQDMDDYLRCGNIELGNSYCWLQIEYLQLDDQIMYADFDGPKCIVGQQNVWCFPLLQLNKLGVLYR